MPRIVVLTTGHTPSDPRVFLKEIGTLRRRYADITMICPGEAGRRERRNGVQVVEVRGRRGTFNRLEMLADLYREGLRARGDAYHTHEPDSLLVGWLIKQRRPCRLVYDSHEFHSDMFADHFPRLTRGLVSRLIRMLEGTMARDCDLLISTNWLVRDYLRRWGATRHVEILFNVPDLEQLPAYPDVAREAVPTFCHEGTLDAGRGLVPMLEAFERLGSEREVRLLLVGRVRESVREVLESLLSRPVLRRVVEPMGYLPNYSDIGRVHARAHVGLICLQPSGNNWQNLNNKLFNYMRYGLAVIGPEYNVSIARVVRETGCGVLVDCRDPGAIAEACRALADDPQRCREMGERGRFAVERFYNWGRMGERLLAAYESLLKRPAR